LKFVFLNVKIQDDFFEFNNTVFLSAVRPKGALLVKAKPPNADGAGEIDRA
jgi:hypothetical protein